MPTGRLRLSRLELAVLGAVLLTALTVRLWGAFFGLPHIYHLDEGFEVYRAVRLGMGGFDMERWPKGGYYFLLFIEYGVYFVVMFLTGAVSGVWDFATHFVTNPEPFWKIGRVTTAVLGLATVFLVWWHGRRIAGPWCGLAAAWFLALSYFHVESSHYITVDVPMTLCAFWSIAMVVDDVTGRRRLNPYLYAPVAAFAVLCKFPAILLVLPYIAGSLMRGGLTGPRGLLTRATILPAVAAMAIYLVLNPGFLLNVTAPLRMLFDSSTIVGTVGATEQANLWLFYINALRRSQGEGTMLIALIGIAIALVRYRREAILHLAFLVPFFLSIAGSQSSHLYYERYVLPLLPGLCLFAGIAMAVAIDRLRPRLSPRALFASGAAAAILLVLVPAWDVIRLDRKFSRPDTRTQAVDWIAANIPEGSRILIQGAGETETQLAIPLTNIPANIERMIERLRQTDPGKALYWELRLKHHSGPAYDLLTVPRHDLWGTLAEYRAAGARYFVLRRLGFAPDVDEDPRKDREWTRTRQSFYQEMLDDDRAELLIAFDPKKTRSAGTHIEIWRLQ